MTTQLELSAYRYPKTAGFKRNGTSQESAERITPRAETLREKCLEALKDSPKTADQVARHLGESILSIRPRFSELLALGKIKETGERRKNESGHSANVWTLAA